MTIEEFIKTLDAFVPFSDDDLENDTEKYLYRLMAAWKQTPDKEKAVPMIFRFMERYPDTHFGSPGPLVHAIESLGVRSYQDELQLSLLRQPTPLTIWMYNRVINSLTDPGIIGAHLQRLALFARHPLANEASRREAEDFIEHQRGRLQG